MNDSCIDLTMLAIDNVIEFNLAVTSHTAYKRRQYSPLTYIIVTMQQFTLLSNHASWTDFTPDTEDGTKKRYLGIKVAVVS